MVEFYYWREGGGKSRLECVVLFLPDVWSAQASRVEWSTVHGGYRAACDAALAALDGSGEPPAPAHEDLKDKSKIVCSQFLFGYESGCARLYLLTDNPAATIYADADFFFSIILRINGNFCIFFTYSAYCIKVLDINY